MKSFYLFSILFILSISLFAQIPLPEAVTYYEVQNNGFWEDPTIWNTGSLPPDDAVVVIPAGKEVKITSKLSARHKFIQIDGYLSVARNEDTQILVETIQISNTGYFRIGTPTNGVLENNTAEIVFINDGNAIDRTWDTQQLSRGLVSLGKVEVFGAEKKHFIVFNADLFKDSNQIELANGVPSNWKIGDKIVIPGTIFERNVAFQDEKLTIANIEGQTITLVETLQFDHIRVRDDMPLHLANLTRNVIFRSEATEIPLRGHTMFMNNDNFAVNTVQIENAAFIDLGRTDKSIPLDEIIVDIPSATINPGPSNNKRGRYAVHFHKNGYGADVNTPPSSVEGCVVESTAGWGFVNHSSHVDIRKNVCYDFVGAAFVTESGDELGNFIENIAIKGTGNGEYRPTRLVFFNEERPQPLSDFGFSGDGFWFQGPAIRAINNVAANCNGAGMIWFTIGSIEIENNKMIGMDSSIVRQAYADYPNIATLNERRWKHATNEVFLADLPILQCDNFQAYACFKGFRIRFNNTDTTPFFSTDFGATDIWEYKKTILPAKGYEPNKQIANRLRQYVSNINVWNNEEGFTVRYSSNSTVSNVNIINKIRAYDIYLPFAGLSCFHTTRLYDFNNLHIENYPIGAFVVEKNEDINNPAATISNNTLTNVANNFYNLKNAFCSKAQNIFSKNINPNTTEIHFDRDIANNIAILRYKQENEMYWNYLTATQANIITLNNLQTATTYQYQILLGNAHKTSLWSDEHHFTTTCQIFNCAYAIQNNVVLNECIISTCINDVVKLSLNTTNGTSIWTGPNNYSAVGNINNTVNIGAITPFSYGIYTAT
ncbi:MAG: G8 domain-containing protein, partial [Chitinophagales bacterium]